MNKCNKNETQQELCKVMNQESWISKITKKNQRILRENKKS